MGAAVPVVGAVMGVASAVQQNNAARQQADAQKQALAQQSLVEQNNTKLRLIELERQKLYSDFNFQIQTASREINKFADMQALNVAEIQDKMQQQQREYATRAGTLQQMQQTLGLDQGAIQAQYGSQLQAQGILGAESEQARQALTGQANESAAINAREQERRQNLANAYAQFSGGEVAGLSLSDVANLTNIQNLSANEIQGVLTRYNDIVDQVSQGKLNAQEVARLISQYGQNEADFLRQSAQASRQFLQSAQSSDLADIASNAQQNALAFQAARSAQATDYTIQEANQRLNQSYYDIQNKSDISTVKNTSAQNQAALAIQRSSIQSPSSFGILGALVQGGMSIANVFGNKPAQATSQPATSTGMFSQVPYSSFAGGSPNQYGLLSGYSFGGFR